MLRKERENAHKHTPHQRFPSLMEEESWKRMESNQWSERKREGWNGLDLGLVMGGTAARQQAQREDKPSPSMNFLLPSLKKSNEFNEREEWRQRSPIIHQINLFQQQMKWIYLWVMGRSPSAPQTKHNNSILFRCLSLFALLWLMKLKEDELLLLIHS